MKISEISLLYNYILNQRNQLEDELSDSQARLRYRNISETECLELALLKERYNTFIQVTTHIIDLLKLSD